MKIGLPTLFKKTSTGAIQFWKTFVVENSDHSTAYDIWTVYGQVDGKEQQTFDTIFEGKNIGKKNETSPKEQAHAEAKSKWGKQKKKGYVETIDDAQDGKLDDLIEGGVVPMLAHKFSEQAHKIKYPCYVQPKLDGIRCIAIVKDGECSLWSRTRKRINSCPHIVQELEAAFANQDVILDGELYNHDFKSNFEQIVSMVRQDEPHENHLDIQYHVYDMVTDEVFEKRYNRLFELFRVFEFFSLKLVDTKKIDETKVMDYFEMYRSLHGYEGAMLRNADSKYVNKRSYDLQKVKEFLDSDYVIVGIEEGRGKLQGHVGAFICETSDKQRFNVKMSGDTGLLKKYFENHKLWSGMELTVQYQGLTSYGVPRFPVGKAIRDYE